MSIIKYLQLPLGADAARMKSEIAAIAGEYWKLHYNTAHYTGNWSVIPLRSPNGDPANSIAVHASATDVRVYADTPLMDLCPYISSVLEGLRCEKTSVRLLKLEAGAVIRQHADHDMCYEQGEVRLHIPVMTSDLVEFYIEDERIPMREGECWYLNLQMPHRVNNGGTQDRIHLVIDCIVNDWVGEMFNDPALAVKKIVDAPTGAGIGDNLEQVIRELRLQNTETADRLADEMEKGTYPIGI